MDPAPSCDGGDGRTEKGRFAPGNKYSRGNPLGAKASMFRAAMFECVTREEMQSVIRAVLLEAQNGSIPAAKELLDRLVGKAEAWDLMDRIEQLEALIERLTGVIDEE